MNDSEPCWSSKMPMDISKPPVLPKSALKRTTFSSSKTKLSVSFDIVEVKVFTGEIGGNVCSKGCPISLGWQVLSCAVYGLEAHEDTKFRRRNSDDLRIPRFERMERLLKAGYTIEEIDECTLETAAIRTKRENSIHQIPTDRFRYAMETVQRLLSKKSRR
jgi:hypothetical protein